MNTYDATIILQNSIVLQKWGYLKKGKHNILRCDKDVSNLILIFGFKEKQIQIVLI